MNKMKPYGVPDFEKNRFLPAVGMIVFFILLFVVASAHAQENNSGEAGGVLMNIRASLADIVGNIFGRQFTDNLRAQAQGMANLMVPAALWLAGTLAIITLVWRVLLAMSNRQSAISAATEVVIFSSIAALLITNFQLVVDQVWNVAMVALVGVGLDIGEAFTDFLTAFVHPLGAVFNKWFIDTKGHQMFSGTWILSSIDMLGALLMIVAIVILMFMSIANIVGVFIMGPVFFSVGIIFAPFMIATIVSDWTRKWFDQWFNFMVGAAFLTVTAVAVLKLLTLTLRGAAASLSGGSSILAMLSILLLVAGINKLFSAVPAITDAIFPGRTGAGAAISTGGAAKIGGAAAAGGAAGGMVGAAVGTATGGASTAAGAAATAAGGQTMAATGASGMAADVAQSASSAGNTGSGSFRDKVKSTFADAAKPFSSAASQASRSASANPISAAVGVTAPLAKGALDATKAGIGYMAKGGAKLAGTATKEDSSVPKIDQAFLDDGMREQARGNNRNNPDNEQG